jgi:hypothetical protein
MPDLLDQLREQRATARTAADDILTRAASESREPTAEELAAYQAQVIAEREAADAMEAERDRQLAEVRAAVARRPGPATPREPVLTREQSVYEWLQARGSLDGAEQELSFDKYLRGLATAKWDGAEHERALAEATIGAGGALVPSPLTGLGGWVYTGVRGALPCWRHNATVALPGPSGGPCGHCTPPPLAQRAGAYAGSQAPPSMGPPRTGCPLITRRSLSRTRGS